jgi:nitrile hydratase accessory protein
VFEAPWEGRAFGLAVGLSERGLFEWEEFRRSLIREIAAWERAHPDGEGFRYYALWLEALERLLAEKRICAGAEIERRATELASRPAGHDHAR